MKFALFAFATILILLFQNCGNEHVDLTALEEGGGSSSSLTVEGFEQTLQPVVQNSCGASFCHGSSQTPAFASSDSEEAFGLIQSNSLISESNPASSRLVQKVLDGHQGIASSVADQIESAIENWINY